MKLLGLLRCLKHNRARGVGFYIRPGSSFITLHSTRRFTSSIASKKSPTSLRYENGSDHLTSEQGNLKLVKLVEEAQFGAANRLLLQLRSRQIEIRHHPVFEKAAISALKWDNPEECLKEFTTWLYLVPNANEAFPPTLLNPLQNVRKALFHSGVPSEKLDLVRRFGIVCANKGYSEPVFHEIYQFITKYDNPRRCISYMLRIEQAATQFQLDHNPAQATAVAQKFRALAIETCTQLKWLYHASKLAQWERDFMLPEKTYEFLLERLKLAKQSFAQELVPRISQELELSRKGIGQVTKVAKPIVKSHTSRAGRSDHAVSLHVQNPALDRLIKVFRTPILTPMESSNCKTLSRSNPRRDYTKVLEIFSANFTILGLDGVFDHTLSRILAASPSLKPEPKAPIPLLLPIHFHWIILRSIVRLSTTLPWPLATLESLYTAFLRHPQIPGSPKVRGSFISEFGRCGRLDLAEMVMNDMQKLGIKSGYSHMGRLAAVYARAGKVDQAMDALDKIEKGKVILPRYTTYGRIIEGFVEAGMLEPALAVEARLTTILPYIRGSNHEFDRVIDSLRALQNKRGTDTANPVISS